MHRLMVLSALGCLVAGAVIAENPPVKLAPRGPAPSFVLEELSLARRDLLQARTTLRQLQLELKVLQAREKALPTGEAEELLLAEVIARDVETASILKSLNKVESDRNQVERVVARDQAAELLKRLQDQQTSLQKDLGARRQAIAQRLRQQASEKIQREYRGEVLTLTARIEATRLLESDLVAQISNLEEIADRNDLSNEALGRRISRLEDDLKGMKSTLDEIKNLLKKPTAPMAKPE